MVIGSLTATEKRLAVVKKYKEILGRNKYSSQPKHIAIEECVAALESAIINLVTT